MEDMKVRKLREKLGISANDQKEAAGKAIGPNLRTKISSYSGQAAISFLRHPWTMPWRREVVRQQAATSFLRHRPTDASVAVAGGNFVSAPPAPDA